MRIWTAMAGAAVAVSMVSLAGAAETAAGPQPVPEQKALGAFVGEWAGTADLKPGPFGPGGKMEWTESCSWFAGAGFHVVCKSKGHGPMGPMKGLGVMGYDVGSGEYVHFGVDSSGWMGYARGKREGDTWWFESDQQMGGKTFRGRFEMTLDGPDRMSFVWKVSEDGQNWTTLMEGTSRKTK